LVPDRYEYDSTNWELEDEKGKMGKDDVHIETTLRGLQAMATKESMLKHKDDWNLVDHVFDWLKDYTENRFELGVMLPEVRELHAAKARLATITDGTDRSSRTQGAVKIE
jgi:hypothetical protein